MEILRKFGRVTLGFIILSCGLLLLFKWNPSTTLPDLLSRFEPLKALAPHAVLFFKINAVLFCLAGILAILNLKFAAIMQALGSLMFVATYDNPMLYEDWDSQVQRVIFILCHLTVIAALWQCGSTVVEKPVTKVTKSE